jgi:hypothetical protein
MSKLIIEEEHRCSNSKWRYCLLDAGICKNCKRCYLEAGDIIDTVCNVCNEQKKCKIDRVYTNSSFKEIKATCRICNSAEVAVDELANDFTWCTDERYHVLLEQILELPKDDLRIVLTRLHKGVER